MTYILTAGKKKREKCWPFTAYSLTSQNAVNLLQPHSKTDKMFCQSAFVRRGSRATWQCGRIPRCHTLPLHPRLISIGLWWQHLTHDRQRPSLPFIPGEPIWQQTDLTDWLTHILTNWLTDRQTILQSGGLRHYTDDKQRGQTSCRLRVKSGTEEVCTRQSALFVWKVAFYAATHQSRSYLWPRWHPLPHCRCSTTTPHPPAPELHSKTWKVRNSSRKGRETKMLKDSERLVALCATLPSSTGAVHGVRCQSLSNMGHPSNPIQWQKGGLAATHVTYIRGVSARCCQAVKAPAIIKGPFVV